MIAIEMPAAISPYSMAVAPESSFTNRANVFFIANSYPHVVVSERHRIAVRGIIEFHEFFKAR
jgi:hypothetical protein